MARGVTLLNLRNQLKVELGDALEVNSAADARYNYLLANKQSDLADEYDWAFLKRQWDLSLDPGDRYVEIPSLDIRGTAATPNFERPMKVDVYFNAFYNCLGYGIGPAEYNYKNSDLDEQQDPVMKWQVATNVDETENEDQIEVWPIPVTNQTLRFVGQRQIYALAVDADTCELDSNLIVYGVAADLLAKGDQKNAGLMLRRFNERLLKIRAGMPSTTEVIQFGYREREERNLRPIVLAGGRPVSSYSGAYALGNGVDSGAVVFGSALSYTPTAINLTVTNPSGGLNIFATVVAGSLTAAGFSFTLSGLTDSDEYVLNYIVTP